MSRNFNCPVTDAGCRDPRCKDGECVPQAEEEARRKRAYDEELRRRGIVPGKPEDYGV